MIIIIIIMIIMIIIMITSCVILIFLWAIEPMALCKCVVYLSSIFEPGYYWVPTLLFRHSANDPMHNF